MGTVILALVGGLAVTTELSRRRIEEHRKETQDLLARSFAVPAMRLLEGGDAITAAAMLVESNAVAPPGSAWRETNRIRLGEAFRRIPRLRTLFNIGAGNIIDQITPDGRYILVRDLVFRRLQVRETSTGRPVSPPIDNPKGWGTCALSPDGATLLFHPRSPSILKVIDVRTGRPRFLPRDFKDYLVDVAFAGSGARFFTVHRANDRPPWIVRLRDTRTMREIARVSLPAATYPVFSPDGRWIAGSGTPGTLWSAATGRAIPLAGHPAGEPAFTTDGRWVAWVSDAVLRVWDTATGRPVTPAILLAPPQRGGRFSPDGRRFVTVDGDGRVYLRGMPSGRTIAVIGDGLHRGTAFSSDGRRLWTSVADGGAQIWDARTGKPAGSILRCDSGINFLSCLPGGHRILTTSENGIVRIWDAPTAATSVRRTPHSPWRNPRFDDSGRRVAAIEPDGARVRIWNAMDGTPVSPPIAAGGRVAVVKLSPDGRRVAIGCVNGTASVRDAETGRLLFPAMKRSRDVWEFAFSPDGRRVAVGGLIDMKVRIHDAATGRALTPSMTVAEIILHYGLRFSPDGRRLVAATALGDGRVWDAATGRPLTPMIPHGGIILSASFHPRVWDTRSGMPVIPPNVHPDLAAKSDKGLIEIFRFSPDGRRMLTRFGEGIRVWDAETGSPLTPAMRHSRYIADIAFTLDGRGIVVLDGASLRLWDASSGLPLAPPIRCNPGWLSLHPTRIGTDGRIVAVLPDETIVWEPFADRHTIDEEQDRATVLAGGRIDVSGAIDPLNGAELERLWRRLHPAL